jgi:pimeloyl-ACP methyl ester carboxylesterase
MRGATAVTDSHQTAQTSFVDVNGVSLAFRRIGPSLGIPLVMLQRFRGNIDDWDPLVVDGLAYERPVVLFDGRGIGRSGGTTPSDVDAMAGDAAAFIDALGERHVDLLGFSLGGMVAQQMLIERPELIRTAILVGTGPRASTGVFAPDVEKTASKIPADAQSLLSLFFEPSESSQSAGRRHVERLMLRADREPPTGENTVKAHVAAIRAWTQKAGSTDKLANVRLPVLVVSGSHDIMIPTANSYNLSQQLPNAELIVYPDSGHGSLFQYPERFARDVAGFVADSAP